MEECKGSGAEPLSQLASGFTALTLECFCSQYVELKKGVFQEQMDDASKY